MKALLIVLWATYWGLFQEIKNHLAVAFIDNLILNI